MLADNRPHIRELALRRILKIRYRTTGLTPLRVFKIPKFNFDAQNFVDLIDWKNPTEPPFTKVFSTEVISRTTADTSIVDSEIMPVFQTIPCHTQAIERHIKLVTEASVAVCG